MKENYNHSITPISFDTEKQELVLLDQTLLPNEIKFISLRTQKSVWYAIYSLQVRGAPHIGTAAAYGIYMAAVQIQTDNYDLFYAEFIKAKEYLATARPTAVNLFWALNLMEKCVCENKDKPVQEIKRLLYNRATEIKEQDIRVCESIGKHGLALLSPNMGILTHCNAGRLAAGNHGTALSPIYLAHQMGYNLKVYADETRPLLQGARLTAFELYHAGVDVTLICDNMAAEVMKKGWVQAVFVGCDRVAANGDAANKIGTLGVAVLAKNYNIPFYVCAPTSTIDLECETGDSIIIEQRNPQEVSQAWYKQPMTPDGVQIFNPAFDVTDAEYITAIITENGIAYPPYNQSLKVYCPAPAKNSN